MVEVFNYSVAKCVACLLCVIYLLMSGGGGNLMLINGGGEGLMLISGGAYTTWTAQDHIDRGDS